MDLASALNAEKALAVLVDLADDEGYVSSTGKTLGLLINSSATTANRAIARLEREGAVQVVRAGGRTGPTLLRLLRRADPDRLREPRGTHSCLADSA